MRYKIIISYDGSNFSGYQKQVGSRTVQDELEQALNLVCKEEVTVHASGRTDAGVHAKGQVVHFDTELNIKALDMQNALNATLPNDIYVRLCNRVSSEFHSRYDAKSKVYEYLINVGEYNPILRNYVLQYCNELDCELMREGAQFLIGEHDFTSFTTGLKGSDQNCVRTIESIEIVERGSRISLLVEGDGFTRHMVRCIVGTLIEVGNGNILPSEVESILNKKDREEAFHNVDGCGLYLTKVYY